MACVIVVCRTILTLDKPLLRPYLEGSSVRQPTPLINATTDGRIHIQYASMQAPHGWRNKSLNDHTKKAPTTLKAEKNTRNDLPKSKSKRGPYQKRIWPTQKRLYLLALHSVLVRSIRFWGGHSVLVRSNDHTTTGRKIKMTPLKAHFELILKVVFTKTTSRPYQNHPKWPNQK